jgi:flavin-dependent dehydrogenase
VGEYDRVIDATGAARAFLPPIEGDRVARCVQRRVRTPKEQECRIRAGGVGYAWCFPLDGGDYHLGCGTLLVEPQDRLDELGWVAEAGGEGMCGCASDVRLTGAHRSQPFVWQTGRTRIWGVGEAIGCVAPLAGDGIVPGMRSVALLLARWGNPAGYARDILREFRWMRGESRILDKLLAGRRLSSSDAMTLRRNARRMGMEVGIREAVILMARIRGSLLEPGLPPGRPEAGGVDAPEQGSRPESQAS